jgi:hypothetical protein
MLAADWRKSTSFAAAEAELVVNRPGMGSVTFQLSGTFTATVTFEATDMNGSSPSWIAIPAVNVNSGVSATTATAAGIYRISSAGYVLVRARCSAFTSGPVDVVANASHGTAVSASTVSVAGAVDTELPAAAALADATANPTVPAVGAHGMVWNGTTWDRAKAAPSAAGSASNTGVAFTQMGLWSTTASASPVQATNQLSDAGTGVGIPPASNWSFNGATWDRLRNNVDVTLLASAARTTTQTSADITTYNAVGIHVVLDMTVVGTGSVTVSINGKDSVSGKFYTILAGAAVITNSTNVYRIFPGATVTANVSANDHLPRVIQIVVTANNANAATYSVGYCLLV